MKMAALVFWLMVVAAGLIQGSVATAGHSGRNGTEARRAGKVFSLFNVVQFKNSECRSTSALSGGTTSPFRNGTCYTATECAAKAGTVAGNCAAGFGVCCVFVVSAGGATISQNCTYIRNPGFPAAYAATSALSYTVSKTCPNICFLRLDFESFTIAGTANTTEITGGVCSTDTFTVTTTPKTTIPVICGQNMGQHMYIDIGSQPSDSATLAFSFSGTSSNRQWEIKVSQLPCGASGNPPVGCLQYQTGLTGRLTTFNFIPTTQTHLASQDYSICIRQELGYCCIAYSLCPDANSFSLLGMNNPAAMSFIDTYCGTLDQINIPDSGTTCSTSSNGVDLVSRYCGAFFNAVMLAMTNAPIICSCHQPFMVGIFTDSVDNAIAVMGPNRGLCLNWMQTPCTTG